MARMAERVNATPAKRPRSATDTPGINRFTGETNINELSAHERLIWPRPGAFTTRRAGREAASGPAPPAGHGPGYGCGSLAGQARDKALFTVSRMLSGRVAGWASLRSRPNRTRWAWIRTGCGGSAATFRATSTTAGCPAG